MNGAAPASDDRAHFERDRQLVESVYRPPWCETHWRLEQLVGHERVRYFSLGRHALAAALRLAGVTAGDVVLLPEFICREVLAALNAVAAKPAYYPVSARMGLGCDAHNLPPAKAVLAVDYLGFPQELGPFSEYCARSGAVLIEDNAHGLFSRDTSGCLLGTRADLSIFSLRKTLASPDGAALAVNNPAFAPALGPQLAFDDVAAPISFRVRDGIRRLVPIAGPWPARMATMCVRAARRAYTGHAIPPSARDAEQRIPLDAAPSGTLLAVMAHTDVAAECARRRELYQRVAEVLDAAGFAPLFDALPAEVVPYGYPFVADQAHARQAIRALAQFGLECLHWPELPDAVAPSAPAHYRSVWMASFLW